MKYLIPVALMTLLAPAVPVFAEAFAEAFALPEAIADVNPGGSVEADVGGQRLVFPLLRTDVDVDIQGDLAQVKVVQTFSNPLREAVHARYLFPLNKDAAVHHMSMQVGNELIRAQIERVEVAERKFDAAKKEGRAAALLKQHRPNMFTQEVANLMPGLPIRVEIQYAQTVPKVDAEYELVVPLVVGPRFQPQGSGEPPPVSDDVVPVAAEGAPFGQWELELLPSYPPVIPDEIGADRVGLHIVVNAGVPIQAIESPTHAVSVDDSSPYRNEVVLTEGRTIDNRDFVLRYALGAAEPQAGVLAHMDERGGFFSVLIEPPAAPAQTQILPREMVFVLDCSGSMSGTPMAASKAFMRAALEGLRPTDSFRIIRFSDSATEFSATPLPASASNVRRGIAYTDSLAGMGGTMMSSGIRQALAVPTPRDAVRIVVFLTDGYIGNEFEILRLIENRLDDARLYAFGVGTGVNRYLLSEMARVGHGFARYMDPTEDIGEVAETLAMRLDAPVLTDIEIDWGDMPVEDVTPALVPDLFAGESVRVQGRYREPGRYHIGVRGRAPGHQANLRLEVALPDEASTSGGEAIAAIWARSAVRDAMHALITPAPRRSDGASDDNLKARVTQLGLDYNLVTRWTAFVATSEQVYNTSSADTKTHDVPLPMVKGVNNNAYPAASFGGYAAPEAPLGLALAALLGLLAFGVLKVRMPNVELNHVAGAWPNQPGVTKSNES